jgi:imidazolonepropionase-like amidohydrolase
MVRKLLFWLAGVVSLCGGATASAEEGGTARQRREILAIVGVTILPMTAGPSAVSNRTVLIQDGRIAAIGARAQIAVPPGARVIDGRGRYLIPGLADMHVHLEYHEDPEVLSLFLGHGVTTVRNMGARPFLLDWRERVRTGKLIGPQIITAGPVIDGSPPAREHYVAVSDGDGAGRAVSAQAEAGYDFIKVYSGLPLEAYQAVVQEGKRRGLAVAGHIPRSVSLQEAIVSQWSIEHLSELGPAISATSGKQVPPWAPHLLAEPIDEKKLASVAQALARAGVWIVPTTIVIDRSLAPPAEIDGWVAEPAIQALPGYLVREWRRSLEASADRLKVPGWAYLEQAHRNRLSVVGTLHRAGVRLVVGTDTPNPFVAMGASIHLELANFVAAGLTPLEALRAATVAPATMLGLEGEQGTIEVGKKADLLLLAHSPLGNIAHVAQPIGLSMGGRWFGPKELQVLRRELPKQTRR